MINFRYHVVSLAAVFFALAVGLVVGTAALNGPAADSLRDQVSSLGQQNQQLREQVSQLGDEVSAREEFLGQLAPLLLDDRLDGVSVLVLSTRTGRDHVPGVTQLLTIAGARVGAQVELADKFTDPEFEDELLDLSVAAKPPGVTSAEITSGDGVDAAAALVAAVLRKGVGEVSQGDRRRVMLAYSAQGYLLGDDVSAPVDAVVVVTGSLGVDEAAAGRTAALLTLVRRLDQVGHVLVTANGDAGDDNLVALVRADPVLSRTMSTVDNVGTPQGRFVTAWAVADEVTGRVGHYGVGPGAILLPATPR